MATPNCGSEERNVSARVILLGEPKAGKSSLFYRIKHRRFKEGSSASSGNAAQRGVSSTRPLFGAPTTPYNYDTCSRKIALSQDLHVNLTLMDIRTEERGQSPSAHYYRRVQAVLLVCSLDNEFSLTRLTFWLEEAKLYCNEQRILFAVVGTKSDLPDQQREVTDDTLSAFAIHHRLPLYLVSAKTGDGIDNMLKKVAQRIVDQRVQMTGTGSRGTQDTSSGQQNEYRPLWASRSRMDYYGTDDDNTPMLRTQDLRKQSSCPCCAIL